MRIAHIDSEAEKLVHLVAEQTGIAMDQVPPNEKPATVPKQRIPIRRKLGFAVVSLVTVLAVLEGMARIFIPAPASQRFRQINEIVLFLGTQPSDMMLQFDPERFWKLKPGIRIDDPDNVFWQGTISNSLGYRCPEFTLKKPADTLRIVCFGDSSTFGIGARMNDTWPSQLQQMLQNDVDLAGSPLTADGNPVRTVQVINAGVPGYTSYQGLQHMRQELERLQADIVLASYANNDFWYWDNTTDAQHASSFSGSGVVSGLVSNSRLVGLMKSGIDSARRLTAASEQSAASPNQHWAQSATSNYGQSVSEWTRRVPLPAFRENISCMADLCRARGIPLILVRWPDQPQAAGQWSPRIDYQDVLFDIAAQRQLPIADVVSMFQANQPWSVRTYVPNDIVHVNRDGNRLAAVAARRAVHQILFRSDLHTN